LKITHCIRIGLRHPDDFRSPALVSPFVTELAAQGFILRDLWRDESRAFYSLWWGSLYDPSAADVRALSDRQKEELFTPRVSPVLQASLERLFTGDFDFARTRLGIAAYSTARMIAKFNGNVVPIIAQVQYSA
jgi:hypothetical protein